jgi:hypothetical protein
MFSQNGVRESLKRIVTMSVILCYGGCSNLDLNSTPNFVIPAINGFNAASDVEPANLIAYWPFNGSFNESQQNLTPTLSTTSPTFVTGIKGQAYQGKGGTYITYPLGTIATAQSLTVSIWFNQPAAPTSSTTTSYIASQGAQGMLMVYSDSSYQVLDVDNELYATKAGHDSLAFNAGFESLVSTPTKKDSLVVAIPQGYFTNATGLWTQLVMTYDATTSKYTLYQNGQLIGVSSYWSSATTQNSFTVLTGKTGLSSTAPLGALKFKNPLGLIIGAFPQVLNLPAYNLTPQPMFGNFQGALDEIRIYKVALSPTEVTSLYQLEFAGR